MSGKNKHDKVVYINICVGWSVPKLQQECVVVQKVLSKLSWGIIDIYNIKLKGKYHVDMMGKDSSSVTHHSVSPSGGQ